jgi:hypothetical protein
VESVKYAKLTMSQTIPAHFDGQHILLDEAVELEPNTKLLVTVLPKDVEREEWLRYPLTDSRTPTVKMKKNILWS